MRIFAAALVSIVISGCNHASGEKSTAAAKPDPTFTDAQGIQWKRHVLTEPRKDHRTLLLVIDEPMNKNVLAKEVLRKSFEKNQARELQAAKTNARNLLANPSVLTLTPTNNPIWPIDRAWTDQDELDYQVWVNKTAATDYMVGGGVQVDCADYAIALRWIYSHDHHLPAGDNLAATGVLFGSWQSTTAWDSLPTDADWKKDERFKAALRYVLNLSFTHSIFTDLYPIAITPEFVTPGAIFLTLETESGHTRTVFIAGPSPYCDPSKECMMIIWGNEPASEEGFITDFIPYKVASDGGGFLRWRWPELTPAGWQLRPAQNMRGYSVEQYGWDEADYLLNVSTRLNLWNSPEQRYRALGQSLALMLQQRNDVTQIGYVLCSLVPCTPQDPLYSSYSTPVRDNAIAKVIKTFQVAASHVDPNSQEVQDMRQNTDYNLFDGSPFTLYQIMTGNLNTQFSSDPSVDFFSRWGIANLSADGKILADIEIAVKVFGNFRYDKVLEAHNLCFPNGGTTPECDPNDAKVKALNTDRVDQGLRNLRTVFRDTYAKASTTVQAKVDRELKNMSYYESFCPEEGCTMYEFLLGPVDHWAVMTSNADSPYRQRFGY